jgi:hypothetical protein
VADENGALDSETFENLFGDGDSVCERVLTAPWCKALPVTGCVDRDDQESQLW